MRHFLLLVLVLATGCEAVVKFDRSKIDGGMNSAARAGALLAEDGGAGSEADDASTSDETPASDVGDPR